MSAAWQPGDEDEPQAAKRAAIPPPGRDFRSPLKAIGWAFLGIRGSSAHQRDAARVSPLVWIATAIAAVVVFVLMLIVLVRWLVPAVG